MCATSIRFILLVLSITLCKGYRHHREVHDENSKSFNVALDPSMEEVIHEDENIPESLDETHPRDLNKYLEIEEISMIDHDTSSETEMVNKEKNILIKEFNHPKLLSPKETTTAQDPIPDESENQESIREQMTNLQEVLSFSFDVRSALRNIFEKLLTDPNTLFITPIDDLEKPVMGDLQAFDAVQRAFDEIQSSSIVRQAIAELQSSKAIQNALLAMQNSHVVQHILELQASNTVKNRLEEGFASIQKIMTEASKGFHTAMTEDANAFQKAMAGLFAPNADQEQIPNDVNDALEELFALSSIEAAIAEAKAAAEHQKTLAVEKAASYLQGFLAETQVASPLPDELEDWLNLEAEGQETLSEDLGTVSVEKVNAEVQATSTNDVTSEKPDAEDTNELE